MHKTHIAEWKKEKVKDLVKMINSYPVIAVVDMRGLPTLQLQRIKQQLEDQISVVVTKKSLMEFALKEVDKPNIKELESYFKGSPALLFSKESPFKLFSTLKKNKSSAPAKPGQISNKDVKIESGPTSFPPGPIIGELARVGIIAAVEQGKVTIKKSIVIVKDGEKINKEVADILSKLGIEPMEVGLNVLAIYENGEILTRDILDVDEEAYIKNIKQCARWAINLSVEIGYTSKDNIDILIKRAHLDAEALAKSQNILTDKEAIIDELEKEVEGEVKKVKVEDIIKDD